MKANHNGVRILICTPCTVSYGSKILKWKQITTGITYSNFVSHCFLWFKDTKMKANHNTQTAGALTLDTVSYGSKILKWKQITTLNSSPFSSMNCFLWFKDTKMKANHNGEFDRETQVETVSYGSKILKWKQITTQCHRTLHPELLFPMVQRY